MRAKETPYRYAQFDGLRNDVAPDEFKRSDLVEALNVDIDNEKRVARRPGFGAPIIGGVCHSLWADGDFCLVVSGTSLLRVLPDLSTKTQRTGLSSSAQASYSRVKDRVYWSNSHETGVVELAGSRSWGLPIPALPAASLAVGSLRPGRYLYSVVFVRSDGQESGAPVPALFELTASGGIHFSAFPSTTDSDVVGVRLFVSKTDGEELYAVTTLPLSASAFNYAAQAAGTQALNTLFLQPPPAGQIVATYRGRAYVAVDNFLFPSAPHGYELFDLEDYIQFEGRITLVAPVGNGIIIGTTSEHIFLSGNSPEVFEYLPVAAYGAIPGTLAYGTAEDLDPKAGVDHVAFWVSERGLCAGLDSGAITNLTVERYAVPATDRGAGVIRRGRGMNQYVAVLQGAEKQANKYP